MRAALIIGDKNQSQSNIITSTITHNSSSICSDKSSQQNTINSSMETLPTQDLLDGEFGSDDETVTVTKPVWGRLFPLGTSFTSMDLIKDEYTFGRGENCDYSFSTPVMKKHQCFQAYSKVHFTICKKTTSNGTHIFLKDESSNGTFINGEKVGKTNQQVLSNNDEIALALKKNKAFVYLDMNANDEHDLPKEIRQKYTLTKLLGRGACGEVKLAFAKGSCEKFAVKIISKKKFSSGGHTQINLSAHVMSEVKILKALKHPCIIKIEDVIDTKDTVYIVLELVEGGELFDRVVSIGQYDEPTAKLLFYQMACAIKHLHDQGITHRDLKPENILLCNDHHETLLKVTDFGLSKFVDAGSMMKTFCGTPTYLAPEVLLSAGSSSYTKAIDCWSLGVILFICLVGYPPFSDERKDMELPKQIVGGHYSFPKQHWKDVSSTGSVNPIATNAGYVVDYTVRKQHDDIEVIRSKLKVTDKRETAIDLIKKLMTVDAKKRLTIDDAINHEWLKDEAMQAKAQALMYPQTDGMLPPKMPTSRKRSREGSDEHLPNKRKGSADTTSPPADTTSAPFS